MFNCSVTPSSTFQTRINFKGPSVTPRRGSKAGGTHMDGCPREKSSAVACLSLHTKIGEFVGNNRTDLLLSLIVLDLSAFHH